MADLLSSVIAAHGGLDRWRTVRAIDVTFNFSGGLLDLKGYPGHRRPSASVDAATPRTVFQRLGDESDDRWIFTPNRVWIERRDGTVSYKFTIDAFAQLAARGGWSVANTWISDEPWVAMFRLEPQ